jgi:hypothetical protein
MVNFKSNLKKNNLNYECQMIKFKLDSNTLAMESQKGHWFAIFGPI